MKGYIVFHNLYKMNFKLKKFCRNSYYNGFFFWCVSDDEDSGEDMDVLTRDMIKKQSQQLVDSKNKKRMPRKKKKTKN